MFTLTPTAEEIVTLWNSFAKENNLSRVKAVTDTRKKYINQKLSHEDFNFNTILEEISNSDFLLGKTPSSYWKINFDWIFEYKNNWAKIINGNYRNNDNTKSAASLARSGNIRTDHHRNTAEVFQKIKDQH